MINREKGVVQNSGLLIIKNIDDLEQRINEGFSPEVKGIYVHPKLITFIAFWASPVYALYVIDLMDALHKNDIDLAKEIMKNNNNNLEQELKSLKQERYEKSVRADVVTKSLTIFRKDDKMCQLSCMTPFRSGSRVQVLHSFIFPASLNIKQEIRRRMSIKGSSTSFPESSLQQVLDIVTELNPK